MIVLWMLACSGGNDALDADRDGFFADVDCDDADADAFPGALEFCDGRDNDCNGAIDDDPIDARPWYQDADEDGFGDVAVGLACTRIPGAVRDAGDCNDADASVHPGVDETCDGVDQDCDGVIDEEPGVIWLADHDGDGFGSPAILVEQCEPPAGYVNVGAFDCDDSNSAVFPGASEVCNAIDDDCDGAVDEEAEGSLWYPDDDADGAGVDQGTVLACFPPAGTWAAVGGDCNDHDARIYPLAVEVCDGLDQDCDGQVDGVGTPFSTGQSLPIMLSADGAGGLALEEVDLTSIGSPASVRIAWGDCEDGFTEVPARFVDRWSSVGRPGPDLDGVGVLAVVLDDLEGSTDARLYADPGATGGIVAASNTLDNGRIELAFDSDFGGRVYDDAGLVFEQLTHTPFITLTSGTLPLTVVQQTVDLHPALTIVTNTAQSLGAGGEVDVTTEWFLFSDRPEVWVSTSVTSNASFTLGGSPTWADGVASFAGDVDGQPVIDGLFVRYPRLEVGLFDVEPTGPMRFAVDHLQIAGGAGNTPTLLVSAGVEVVSSRVVLATSPIQGFEVATDRLLPTARAILGGPP